MNEHALFIERVGFDSKCVRELTNLVRESFLSTVNVL